MNPRALPVLLGAALAALLAGGEASARRGGDPMAGYFSAGMPRYPGVQEIPAGGQSRVGGSRLKMAFFVTEDDPSKVARYYGAAWRARRFFVREDITHRGGFVSAVDAEARLIYQVLVQAQGSRTLVYPSETALPGGPAPSEEPPPLPLPRGSRVLLGMGSRESPNEARVQLSVNDGGMVANLAHFEREARAAGWRREGKQGSSALGEGHHMLIFRKADRELTIDLSLVSPAEKRVRVHLVEVGR